MHNSRTQEGKVGKTDLEKLFFNPITGLRPFKSLYAHIEVLVTCLLVNFFVFWVITRDHGSFEWRH